jgi:hypothetical protein
MQFIGGPTQTLSRQVTLSLDAEGLEMSRMVDRQINSAQR